MYVCGLDSGPETYSFIVGKNDTQVPFAAVGKST